MVRYHINPNELKNATNIGYNHGIISNGRFYAAGQVAADANGNVIGDDIETQTRKVYDNIETLLNTIGKQLQDLAEIITYIIEPHERYFEGYKSVYLELFDENYPCHTVIGVDQLVKKEYLVELKVEVSLSDTDIESIVPDGEEITQIQ